MKNTRKAWKKYVIAVAGKRGDIGKLRTLVQFRVSLRYFIEGTMLQGKRIDKEEEADITNPKKTISRDPSMFHGGHTCANK